VSPSFFYAQAVQRMLESVGRWQPIAYRLERPRDWRRLWLRRRDRWIPVYDENVSIQLWMETYEP
jgi:hypothetical protein